MLTQARRVAVLACLLVGGLLLGVVGAFLHPVRVSVLGVGVPVLVPLLLLSLLALGLGGTVAVAGSRLGAALPGGAWLATTLAFSVQRPEGDLVVTGTATSVAYLLLGTVVAGVTVGLPPDVLLAGLRRRGQAGAAASATASPSASPAASPAASPEAAAVPGTADEPPRTRR